MKITCPKNPKHNRFNVIAHEAREWIVDENKEFIRSYSPCLEVVHEPDIEDVYTCERCGTTAIVQPS
jgi:rubrerythrin